MHIVDDLHVRQWKVNPQQNRTKQKYQLLPDIHVGPLATGAALCQQSGKHTVFREGREGKEEGLR